MAIASDTDMATGASDVEIRIVASDTDLLTQTWLQGLRRATWMGSAWRAGGMRWAREHEAPGAGGGQARRSVQDGVNRLKHDPYLPATQAARPREGGGGGTGLSTTVGRAWRESAGSTSQGEGRHRARASVITGAIISAKALLALRQPPRGPAS